LRKKGKETVSLPGKKVLIDLEQPEVESSSTGNGQIALFDVVDMLKEGK